MALLEKIEAVLRTPEIRSLRLNGRATDGCVSTAPSAANLHERAKRLGARSVSQECAEHVSADCFGFIGDSSVYRRRHLERQRDALKQMGEDYLLHRIRRIDTESAYGN